MSATLTQQIDAASDCITTDNPDRQIPINDNFYLHLPMGFLRIPEAKKSKASAIVYCQQLGARTTGSPSVIN
ncbi:hypothetical protein BN14_08311 [Rhizoctonia solani AG-1 IB]|uniref:Uncharacterized protein n=1 Tax=Thanatephorus cucumeris (strain AG1-IB / isolate 7/3/14) TaxID=1108050 RepID=M5CEA1_THACB|nr:hypothetical protein BN14_08311 [Rhizoctonia solani AG-1 IB]